MTKRKPPEEHKKSGRKPRPVEELHKWTLAEIMERCGANDEDECWEWQATTGRPPKTEHGKRFACIKHGGQRVLLRRLAWELKFGEEKPLDPDKRIVMTKCDNPRCNNPTHARQLTEAQKCQRAAKKGSFSGYAKRAKIAATKRANDAKLTMEIARNIRADKRPSRIAAPEYGINPSLYNRIRAGKAWVEFDSNPFARLAA